MKKVIERIQTLGEKAAQLKHAVAGAPAVAAGIRDAVAVTAGQLQQLRADVQAGVSGLRVEDEDRLLAALREVSAGTGVFEEAGFELSGIDVELGLLRRIVVRLDRFKEVSLSRLRSIHAASAGQSAVQAVLNALIKAEEMAAKVTLPDLTFRQLIIDVGPAPTVRVCWRIDAVAAEAGQLPTGPSPLPPTGVPPVLASPSSILGKGSFFEARHPETPPAETAPTAHSLPIPSAPPVPPPLPTPPHLAAAATPTAAKAAGDWKQGALDRFKKMPDLSKPRH